MLFGCGLPKELRESVPGKKTLDFSHREWIIKHAKNQIGPGSNYFSHKKRNVWIDGDGALHLKVADGDDIWKSVEVVSRDTFGYGTYIFTLEGDLNDLDPNVTFGLFTWNSNTFKTQANSEIDIEFAKWGSLGEENVLQYAVHPVGIGEEQKFRVHRPDLDTTCWNGVSTHAFTWTDTCVMWQSFKGESMQPEDLVSLWRFDNSSSPVIKKEEGLRSDPVLIPEPEGATNVRMNLWLAKGPFVGPIKKRATEVIVRNFQYIPSGVCD